MTTWNPAQMLSSTAQPATALSTIAGTRLDLAAAGIVGAALIVAIVAMGYRAMRAQHRAAELERAGLEAERALTLAKIHPGRARTQAMADAVIAAARRPMETAHALTGEPFRIGSGR